jgi:PAS domain S-box-containing protein
VGQGGLGEGDRGEDAGDGLRAHLETLLNRIGDPLFVKDRQHRWQFLNDAYCRFMGYSREQLLGKSDFDFFPAEEAAVFWAKDELVFETGVENLNEEYFTDAQGVKHTILTKKTVFRTARGEAFIIGTIRDVTARKQTEEALIRSQQLAAIGTLAAGIAHEFNNINTSVIGNLQFVLAQHALPDEAALLLQRALRAANRASDITSRLLNFASPGEVTRTVADLDALVRSTFAIVENELSSEGTATALRLGAAPRVLCAPPQISQVLLNLLINARHALLGRPDPRITVEVGVVDGRGFFRVKDTGCGIPVDRLPKIFLPFYSGKGEHAGDDPVQSTVRGSGLGLSISDTIVRNHGGEIQVASEHGRGSTFTVWLPLAEHPAEREPGRLTRPGSTGGRVLILDDDGDVRELLARVLERAGYTVTATGDPLRALDEHAEAPFQVILVDLQMARMSGFEFLARLRAAPGPTAKVVVVTGRLERALEAAARDLGAAALLHKPFDLGELERLVGELASR